MPSQYNEHPEANPSYYRHLAAKMAFKSNFIGARGILLVGCWEAYTHLTALLFNKRIKSSTLGTAMDIITSVSKVP